MEAEIAKCLEIEHLKKLAAKLTRECLGVAGGYDREGQRRQRSNCMVGTLTKRPNLQLEIAHCRFKWLRHIILHPEDIEQFRAVVFGSRALEQEYLIARGPNPWAEQLANDLWILTYTMADWARESFQPEQWADKLGGRRWMIDTMWMKRMLIAKLSFVRNY
jgi:hypothetical protein